MKQSFLEQTSPFTKIIFTIFVALLSFLTFFILGMLIAIPLFNLSLTDFYHLDSASNNILKYFQLIQSISLFIIPAIIISFTVSTNWIKFLELNNKPRLISIFLLLIIIPTATPIINFLVELNTNISFPNYLKSVEDWMREMETNAQELTETFLSINTFSGFLFNVFLIAVIPAIGEELLFRGVLQKFFDQWFKNIHWAIIVTAFLFSVLHLQFYGILPRMVLGAFFGYLLVWSKTIWLPIIAHFINNAIAVSCYYFLKKITENNIDNFGITGETEFYVLISITMVVLLGSFVYYIEKKRII